MITTEQKNKVVQAIQGDTINYKSAAQQARALGINAAQLSRIRSGELEGVISQPVWLSLARRYEINLGIEKEWKAANTEVFDFIYTQLEMCQEHGLSGLLCDLADIGKTFTAKYYTKKHKLCVYVDCSQVKSKQRLVRQIAKDFGVNSVGKYADVYADLVYYLQSADRPMVILDEAGDLDYAAFLELKALWNATERCCGWYMIGADGLRAKIDSNLGRRKVGYAEIFSRYGGRYQKITPDGKEALESFTKGQIAAIVQANGEGGNINKIYAKTYGSLRRIKIELSKQDN